MKVITKGNKPAKWTKRFTCDECEAVLEVEESDLYAVNTAVAYAGETYDPRLRIKCGCCSSEIDVTNKVPSGLQNKLFAELRKKVFGEK